MTLPAGVTLQQINGGPNYYANNGYTYAANAGWDSPSFIPIGPWLADLGNQNSSRTCGCSSVGIPLLCLTGSP